jgi:predicted permease
VVAAEFAAAVVLLTGSGLLIRSFLRIQAVHLGFDPTRLAIADVHLPSPRYDQPERVRSFFEQATSRIAALPGVTGVAVGGLFSDHQPNAILQIEGRADAAGPEPHGRQYVSKEYFRLLGIPLERGRLFSALDHEHSAPTAVINSSMARRFWPNQDPLGKRFRQTLPGLDGGDWLTVVGVVGDVVLNGRESRAVPMFYRPRSQIGFGDASLLVRSAQDPLLLQAAVRHELQLLDPTVPRFEIDTVERRLTSMESSRRFETELLSLFALLALVLAVIGIYGLLHFAVTQRTREVGIRIALGAERTHVIRLILRQGLGWALLGVAVGALAARWMTALLADLLFGVTATDPGTFIAVTFALLLVAAVAAGLPAHRASAIDPLIALREE